ncbi:MAG: hypothetical protein ABUS79_22715, partial [Pseudomonadota bacterium]
MKSPASYGRQLSADQSRGPIRSQLRRGRLLGAIAIGFLAAPLLRHRGGDVWSAVRGPGGT